MPFEWAPGALERLVGVEAYEVMQVLSGERLRRPIPGQAQGMRLLTIWGRTRAGEAVIVVCRHVGGLDYHIAFARPATTTEETDLRRWEEDQQ